MAQVMVLSAGLGTRLRPLSDVLPKPLVPLGNAPLLQQVLGRLRARGFSSAVVNTHHLAHAFDGLDTEGVDVRYSHEPDILGSAGGVRRALPWLEAPFIVCNGDLWADPPLESLRSALGEHAACLLVAPPAGRGTVGLNAAGDVVRLRGERHGEEVRAADYVGVMALGDRALPLLPERGCLVGDLCLPLLRRGEIIATLSWPGPWFDVGTPAGYLGANLHWLREQALENYVSPTVERAVEVRLERCVLGRGARVLGAGRLERCVVWPGASVRAPLRESIVISDGRIVGVH